VAASAVGGANGNNGAALADALAAATHEADALDCERWFSDDNNNDDIELPAAFAFDLGGACDPLEPRPERVVLAGMRKRKQEYAAAEAAGAGGAAGGR